MLGPLLYLLYMSPLPDPIRRLDMKFRLYADDTELYTNFVEMMAWNSPLQFYRKLSLINFEGCYKGKSTKQLQAYSLSSTSVEVVHRMISKEIYGFIDERNLLPEEQKGCRKKERGTKVNSRSPVH